MSKPIRAQRRPEEAQTGRRQIDLPIAKIALLHAAGMSQATLAKRFGVVPSVIAARLKRAREDEVP